MDAVVDAALKEGFEMTAMQSKDILDACRNQRPSKKLATIQTYHMSSPLGPVASYLNLANDNNCLPITLRCTSFVPE